MFDNRGNLNSKIRAIIYYQLIKCFLIITPNNSNLNENPKIFHYDFTLKFKTFSSKFMAFVNRGLSNCLLEIDHCWNVWSFESFTWKPILHSYFNGCLSKHPHAHWRCYFTLCSPVASTSADEQPKCCAERAKKSVNFRWSCWTNQWWHFTVSTRGISLHSWVYN